MAFDYYYGTQADQFNFIKIPKTMITDPMFEDLSVCKNFCMEMC